MIYDRGHLTTVLRLEEKILVPKVGEIGVRSKVDTGGNKSFERYVFGTARFGAVVVDWHK